MWSNNLNLTSFDALSKNDLVFPGEQWFFYWKTSAAMWESKISMTPKDEVLFIPLYWGLHAPKEGEWDFGDLSPEADLKRLIEVCGTHRRQVAILLPMSPMPFLPNGGLPVHVTRHHSINSHGLMKAGVDHEGKLHKFYSFYGGKVFQSYLEFVDTLHKYLTKHKLHVPVYGLEGREFGAHFNSTREDYSQAFDQNFARFLKQKMSGESEVLSDPKQELVLKREFQEISGELFAQSGAEILQNWWRDQVNIVFIGARENDLMVRSVGDGLNTSEVMLQILVCLNQGKLPSTALLTAHEKNPLLSRFLSEQLSGSYLEREAKLKARPEELTDELIPLEFFYLWEKNQQSDHSLFAQGFVPFLEKYFRWSYRFLNHFESEFLGPDLEQERIKVARLENLSRFDMAQLLKLFLMGQKVILDRSNWSEEQEKRFHLFLAENNLETQNVNFKTQILITKLGEGRLFVYDGAILSAQSPEDKALFWQNLMSYLELKHLLPEIEDGIVWCWKVRAISHEDLNYQEIRRIYLYNPTSYRKTLLVPAQKSFAFLRQLDPVSAKVKSTPQGVEVELLPQGAVNLDFGKFA